MKLSFTSIILDNSGLPFHKFSVLSKLIIFSFVVATLYILGMYSSANPTASGITSLICCAINPITLWDFLNNVSIYLNVFGWICKIFSNADTSLISSISFLI